MATFGGTLVKLGLTLVNLFFLLLSLAIFLLGLRMYQRPAESEILDANTWYSLSSMLIIGGIALFAVTLIGLGGALCDSSLLLNAYSYFLVFCTTLVVVLFTCLIVSSGAIVKSGQESFGQMMANFSKQHEDAMYIVQKWQSVASCCGNLGPADWHNSTLVNASELVPSKKLPASCCGRSISLMVNTSSFALCNANHLLFQEGCFSKVQIWRYRNSFISAFVVVVTSLLLLLTCSCCLERERKAAIEKIRNLQYAAHLNTCPLGLAPASNDCGRYELGAIGFQGSRGAPQPPAYFGVPQEHYY